MKSLLTQHIFRQLIYSALHTTPHRLQLPLSRQCLRSQKTGYIDGPTFASQQQRRTFFNLFGIAKRKPKSSSYEPGFETLLRLKERLDIEVRPQHYKEILIAFRQFVKHKFNAPRPDDTQIACLKRAFIYIRKAAEEESWSDNLSADDVGGALAILAKLPQGKEYSEPCIDLAKVLFADSKAYYLEHVDQSNDKGLLKRYRQDLYALLKVLALNGRAMEARQLARDYWGDLSKLEDRIAWPIVQGFIREGRDGELQPFLNEIEDRGISFDVDIQSNIINEYTQIRMDLDQAKEWYYRKPPAGQELSDRTHRVMLGLCIRNEDIKTGDRIVREVMRRNPDDKDFWDMTLRWAAIKGRGVDEIEKMMEVVVQRNPDRPQVHPDMRTVNHLAALAFSKYNDSYTAERYIAMGRKLGFEPDAQTYVIQMKYRIDVNDLSGAMSSYSSLRSLGSSSEHHLPLNHLIIAFCKHRSQRYDAIMSLADDLSNSDAVFLPETVAALAKLHLKRGEKEDAEDLLKTHTSSFNTAERELVCVSLMDHVLDPGTNTNFAWDTWVMTIETFPELPKEIRIQAMQAFFSRQKVSMAVQIFLQMRDTLRKSLMPSADDYCLCLVGISKYKVNPALDIIHNALKIDHEVDPCTKLYNALMIAYTGCNQHDRALTFWQDILHSEEGPSYASLRIALQACEQAVMGEQEARKIWKRVHDSGIEITQELYSAYLGALAGNHLFGDCVKMCEDAEKEGFTVDALMFVHSHAYLTIQELTGLKVGHLPQRDFR